MGIFSFYCWPDNIIQGVWSMGNGMHAHIYVFIYIYIQREGARKIENDMRVYIMYICYIPT
jgi:hypothetical protein